MNNALLVVVLAVLPVGAGTTAVPPLVPQLDGTSWILSTLAGRTTTGHDRVTLVFDAARIRGTDGCNQYTGPYSAVDTRLKIGPEVLSTQMGCPTKIMELASSYMSVLRAANSYRVSGGELLLVGATGRVLATFVRPTKPLAGSHSQD